MYSSRIPPIQAQGFYDAPATQQGQTSIGGMSPAYGQPVHQQQPSASYPAQGYPSGFETTQPAPNLSFYSGPVGGGGMMGAGVDGGLGAMGAMGTMGGEIGGASPTSGGSFDDEPPLLEELGINFTDIRSRMLYVLLPNKQLSAKELEDTDLAGPLLFCMALGVALLMTGKVHFGVIYGISAFGCVSVWAVLNLMHEQGIDMYRICSVLGYGLVPIVLLSLVNVVFDLKGHVGFVLSATSIMWCAFSASRFFERILDLSEQRWLVAYPLCLLYACFALITVF